MAAEQEAPAPSPVRRWRLRALAVAAGLLAAATALVAAWAGREASALVRGGPGVEGGPDRGRFDELRRARAGSLGADRPHLDALAPLQSGGGRADAGPRLNPLLEWPVPWSGRRGAPLSLPPVVAERLAAWGEEHVEALAGIDLSSVDLTWMAALPDYDHWDLERGSPYDEVAGLAFASGWFVDREPRLEQLTAFARLRIMKGLRDGNPWDALREVRQLEKLLVSTETLLGTVEAVVLSSLERQAYVAALGADPEKVQGWHPVGEPEDHAAAIRALRAMPALLTPLSPAADLDELVKQRPFGFCAALRESATRALWLRPLLDERYPDYYRRLDELVANGGCRLTALRAAPTRVGLGWRARTLARIGDDRLPLPPTQPDAPLGRTLGFLVEPSLRAAVGEALMVAYGTAVLSAAR